jgi:RNA polymerase sigma-70 factor (ECF subfamily)
MSDSEVIHLVDGLKRRDDAAFNTLLGRYKTYVYSVAYKRVGNFADAEEVAQIVFVEVYKHIQELKEGGKLLSWLHGITDHASLNWLRKYRKGTASLDTLKDDIAEDSGNPPEVMADREHQQDRVAKAMAIFNSLDQDHQAVLNLRYMEGLSYEDIAGRLEVTRDVVRGRLYRAHLALRRLSQ